MEPDSLAFVPAPFRGELDGAAVDLGVEVPDEAFEDEVDLGRAISEGRPRIPPSGPALGRPGGLAAPSAVMVRLTSRSSCAGGDDGPSGVRDEAGGGTDAPGRKEGKKGLAWACSTGWPRGVGRGVEAFDCGKRGRGRPAGQL